MNDLHPPCSSHGSWRTWLSLLATFFLLALVPAFGQTQVPCEDPSCATTSLSVNTGFNHATGTTYSTGSQDEYWTVIFDANPANSPEPRPAHVVQKSMWWPNPQAGTQWISGNPTSNNTFIGGVRYQRCFCICGPSPRTVNINLNIITDDNCTVFLDGVIIGTVSKLDTVAKNINVNRTLAPGVHCIEILVNNTIIADAGLNVQGTITGTGLLKATCCGKSTIPTPDEDCDVTSLNLNTGYTNWLITSDPSSSGVVPRCAANTTPKDGWHLEQPGTQWISVSPSASATALGTYVFKKCFCVSEQTTLQVTISAYADDALDVVINGVTILHMDNWAANDPVGTVTVPITVGRGCHCIEFRVHNEQGVVVGLNAIVQVKGQNLLREECCYCAACPCVPVALMPGPEEGHDHSDHSAGVESDTRASRSMLMSVPNPTTGETTFHYVVDRSTDVMLELYNAAGERVEVLETGWKEEGNHSLSYDVTRLPAGMYHLRLKFGSESFSLPVNVQ